MELLEVGAVVRVPGPVGHGHDLQLERGGRLDHEEVAKRPPDVHDQ